MKDKEKAQADQKAKKAAYRRLKENKDFDIFYNYLKVCYNSYIEAGGEATTPKDIKDHLLAEAATLHKVISYIDRQAN